MGFSSPSETTAITLQRVITIPTGGQGTKSLELRRQQKRNKLGPLLNTEHTRVALSAFFHALGIKHHCCCSCCLLCHLATAVYQHDALSCWVSSVGGLGGMLCIRCDVRRAAVGASGWWGVPARVGEDVRRHRPSIRSHQQGTAVERTEYKSLPHTYMSS